MTSPTDITKHIDAARFGERAGEALTTHELDKLLGDLPIIGENDYLFNASNPELGSKEGFLHWYPVGGDRGNAGRIKLAGSPENPIAERTINAMESMIELHRQIELRTGNVNPPASPREAARRYFDLPPLSDVPRQQQIRNRKPREYARELAHHIRVRLVREGRLPEYALLIEDDGIGHPRRRAPQRTRDRHTGRATTSEDARPPQMRGGR